MKRDLTPAARKRALACVALVTGFTFALGAGAADIAAGQAKAKEVCAACHGLDGNATIAPDYPKLGGQYPDYLAKALRDYQAGRRKNPIMAGMAAPLTAKDIENVAAYYASQPAVVTTQKHAAAP